MRIVRRAACIGLAAFGGIFVSGWTSAVFAATSDSLTVVIRPLDTTPPGAVTDLQSMPGAANQMLLQWTAPDENNYIYSDKNPVTSYIVRIATFSADSVGSTTTWWNIAQDVTGEPPPAAPGLTEYLLLNGLTGGVTYYAAIKSVDDMGLVSDIDTKSSTAGQQANAYVTSSLTSPPSNFAGAALSTTSIQWSWDIYGGATYYTVYTSPADVPVASVAGLSTVESGFTANVAVTRILRAGNASGVSPPTSPITVYTLAQTPNNLSAPSVGLDRAVLQWQENGNPAGTRYRLERSNNGVSYVPVTLITTTTYQDTGLAQLTTYYYRVRALNGDDIPSAPSTAITIFTTAAIDTNQPNAPAGLKGFLDPTGKAFTLSWEEVKFNSNGTAITDLAGYYIYKRAQLNSTPVRLTTTPLTVTAFADQVDNQVYYYTIRAVDTSGNESEESLFADSSPEANIIYLSTDGATQIRIPQDVNDLLRSAYNKYGVPLSIKLTEIALPGDQQVIRTVRFTLIRTDTNEVLNDLSFSKPQALVAVGYNATNGQVARGAPSLNAKNVTTTAVTPDQLAMYWFNGVTWVRVGGTNDPSLQAIKIKSSFLGNYQLRASANPSTLSLSQGNVYPRLFTPNGDGLNDRVYFVLENPSNVAVSGEIIDKAGRHVRTLPPPAKNSGIGTTLIWDGKDDRGNVVPGDIYIYKISGEGRTFTGTVGVAR